VGNFRVLASRTQVYYTDLEAPNSSEAYDVAEELETHLWNLIEQDYDMEILEVVEAE
jgi:hypothetical protein